MNPDPLKILFYALTRISVRLEQNKCPQHRLQLINQGCTSFQKFYEPHQNCTRQNGDLNETMFHDEDPQIVDSIVQNLVAWDLYTPALNTANIMDNVQHKWNVISVSPVVAISQSEVTYFVENFVSYLTSDSAETLAFKVIRYRIMTHTHTDSCPWIP
jgi:hypothetical protein